MKRHRVRLKCDLTRYRPGLVAGTMGWTMPGAYAEWGIMVQYDTGETLDTLMSSLWFVGDRCPSDEEGFRRHHLNRMKKARDIKLHYGKYGGLRLLQYELDGHTIYIDSKQDAAEVLDVFVAARKRIKEYWPDTPDDKVGVYRTVLSEAKERNSRLLAKALGT